MQYAVGIAPPGLNKALPSPSHTWSAMTRRAKFLLRMSVQVAARRPSQDLPLGFKAGLGRGTGGPVAWSMVSPHKASIPGKSCRISETSTAQTDSRPSREQCYGPKARSGKTGRHSRPPSFGSEAEGPAPFICLHAKPRPSQLFAPSPNGPPYTKTSGSHQWIPARLKNEPHSPLSLQHP